MWLVSHVDCRATLPIGFYTKIVSAIRSPHAALSRSRVSLKCVCVCVFYYFSLVLKKTLSSILSHQEIRPRFPGHLRCDWEQISGASEKLFCKLSTPLQHRWSFTRMGGRAWERREWSQQPETCQVPRQLHQDAWGGRRGKSEASWSLLDSCSTPSYFLHWWPFPAVEVDLGSGCVSNDSYP